MNGKYKSEETKPEYDKKNIKSINASIHFIEVWNKNITGIARMDE